MKFFIINLLMFGLLSANDTASYRFVILGDRTGGAKPAILQQIVKKTLSIEPAASFFFDVGDHIPGYSTDTSVLAKQWKEAKMDYQPLFERSLLHPVAGNHDISYAEMEAAYKKEMGEPDYVFEHGEDFFIVLNNALWSSTASMEAKQLTWLKKRLETAKSKRNVFVFFHIPMWSETPNDKSLDILHNLFKESVDYVFNGHLHYLRYGKRDRVTYITLGSSGGVTANRKADGSSYHYLIMDVKGTHMFPTVITLEGDTLPLSKEKTREWNQLQIFEKSGFVFKPQKFRSVSKNEKSKLTLTVSNNTSDKRIFSLKWSYAKAGDWKISPETYTEAVGPGKTADINFEYQTSSLFNLPTLEAIFIVKGDTFTSKVLPIFERGTTLSYSDSVKIDGQINESVWLEKGSWISGIFGQDSEIGDSTWFALAADKDYLNLAFKAFDNDSANMVIQTPHDKRDAVTMSEESIRFYLGVSGVADTFWQINVSAGNAITDMLVERSAEMFTNRTEWSGVENYNIICTKYGWQGELRIPWTALGRKNPSSIRFNARRDKDSKGRRTFYQEPFTRDPVTFPLFTID